MPHRSISRALGILAVAGAAAAIAVLAGPGMASAQPADPPGGAAPVPPNFYNGNVENIRGAGSDTSFRLMQTIGDLYTGAGLYGCTLNSLPGQTLYNSSDPASTTSNESFFCQSGQNLPTTDVIDNWDRTEVTQGVDDIGSNAGQSQLCGALGTPLPVDFVRSARPAGTACSTMAQAGFAKDGVTLLDFPVNPIAYGTSGTAPYSSINGGVVGDVSQGWLPGDPSGGPFSGTALGGISDNDNGGGASSTAYRIWCVTTPKTNPVTSTSQVFDWGQLTNLGPKLLVHAVTVTSGSPSISINPDAVGTFPPTVASGDAVSGGGIPSGTTVSSVSGSTATLSNNATVSASEDLTVTTSGTLAVGQGLPVGIPIRVMGVNTAAGVESTFALFANSGLSTSGGCSSNMNLNAASDPNPATDAGNNGSPHIALQNNADQINQYGVVDFPSPDYVDQAIEAATTLYPESNGVYNTTPFAGAVTVDGASFAGIKVAENSTQPTTPNLLQNHYPTAFTLYNIWRTDAVRASVGGFINWMCDSNANISKGVDAQTGKNYDTELSNVISSVFGFPRLSDESTAPAIGTPADGQAAPNTTCAASLQLNTTAGSPTVTLTEGGNFPVDIANAGGLVGGLNVGVTGAEYPAGTYVVSGSGTSTLTLSQDASATATGVSTSFSGVPAVTSVASSQN